MQELYLLSVSVSSLWRGVYGPSARGARQDAVRHAGRQLLTQHTEIATAMNDMPSYTL